MPKKGVGDSTGKKGQLVRSSTLNDIFFPSVLYERLQKSYKTVEGSNKVNINYGQMNFFYKSLCLNSDCCITISHLITVSKPCYCIATQSR